MGRDGATAGRGRRLRLVVVGDSFAFTDHEGPQLPDHPALYPNVAARVLAERAGRPVDLATLARPGWDAQEVWRTLTKDRHAQFEVLARADAVVVAIGSFDHVPAGAPRVAGQVVPYLRPAWLRRRVRTALHHAHPRVVALTGGRVARTPTAEFARRYAGVLRQARALAGGAPAVALGPCGHASAHYGRRNPHLEQRDRLQRRLAEEQGYVYVACWPLVRHHLDRLNPDGVHWPHDVHAAVGAALGEALAAALGRHVPSSA